MENVYVKEKRQCILCKLNIEPDYKNVRFLSQFQSRYTGRIYERHITGLCKHKQTRVEEEIRKAQHAGSYLRKKNNMILIYEVIGNFLYYRFNGFLEQRTRICQ